MSCVAPRAAAALLSVSTSMFAGPLPHADTTPPAERRISSSEKPECWVDIRNVSPVVYPAEARHREEQGTVQVEFAANEEWAAPASLKVVSTSGFPLLDDEVLRSVGESQVRTNCPGVRFSFKTFFRMKE